MTDAYLDLIASKVTRPDPKGLKTMPPISGHLRAYQADCVRFGLETAAWGCFLDTGLGKTLIEHEWLTHTAEATNGYALLLTPLGVAQQMKREAEKFGYQARVIKEQSEARPGINICNYDRLHLLEPDAYGTACLDEGAILRSFTGSVSKRLRAAFARHRFKKTAAAVPAPNDTMELGQQVEFLGLMPSNQMLMRWFTADQTSLGKYRLKGHGELAFWDWCASWARMASHPRDLGHPEEGFDLPPVKITRHQVDLSIRATEGTLFASAVSATEIHDVKRQTAGGRAAAIAAVVAQEPDEPWLIWVDTDYEADAMCAALRAIDPTKVIDVRGSMPTHLKEERLELFAASGLPYWIVTKPRIAGWGLNWQHCARAAYAGRSYSYEAFYQTLRRVWRFGQLRQVEVHIAVAEGEEMIGRVLDRKAEDHRKMQEQMAAATRRQISTEAVHTVAYEPTHTATAPEWLGGGAVECLDAKIGEKFALFHGDCVEIFKQLPDACVDMAVYSPPFSGLYIYSDSAADMGNSKDDEEFLRQYRFACEELYRVLRPGRLALVHCKHLVYYKNAEGTAGCRDFPGDLIRVHQSAGFDLHGPPITIWRCPVREMTKTKAHGLLYKQLRADSSFSRQGLPEYILPLRKWAETESDLALVRPVTHTKDDFPLDQWQTWASCVWQTGETDVEIHPTVWGYPLSGDELRETDVLQSRPDPKDEKHICPMPLDIISRCVEMWSNPGDVVASLFAGIGSEGMPSLRLGRKFVAAELKATYFRQAGEYLDGADRQTTLFPVLSPEEEAALSRPFIVPAVPGQSPPPGFAVVRSDLLALDRESHE